MMYGFPHNETRMPVAPRGGRLSGLLQMGMQPGQMPPMAHGFGRLAQLSMHPAFRTFHQ